MALPWSTALYVVRKLMPVIIEKAPELLKSLERRRTSRTGNEYSAYEPSLPALHERIEAQEQLLTSQTEHLANLDAIVLSLRRSLRVAWLMVAASALLALISFVVVLSKT